MAECLQARHLTPLGGPQVLHLHLIAAPDVCVFNNFSALLFLLIALSLIFLEYNLELN